MTSYPSSFAMGCTVTPRKGKAPALAFTEVMRDVLVGGAELVGQLLNAGLALLEDRQDPDPHRV